STITALDLSAEQLERARQLCSGQSNVSFHQRDLYSEAAIPTEDYDAAIAIEVFLHHPPSAVLGFFQRLSALATHIVNIDWSEDWPWKTPEHVWVHDYAALYRQIGWQCATFALPEKIDGLQQKLFVATKSLSATVLAL